MVVDASEFDHSESTPDTADQGFSYALGIAVVQDIVRNLEQQVERPDLETRLRALLYYIENDAFIDLSQIEKP